jgi:hypothetical protein
MISLFTNTLIQLILDALPVMIRCSNGIDCSVEYTVEVGVPIISIRLIHRKAYSKTRGAQRKEWFKA